MSIEQLTLFLAGRKFSFGDLLGQDPGNLSAFERSVTELCRKWIRGDDQFEVTTSGSTGTPKNIVFTRSQLKASAQLTGQALGLRAGMTSLLCLDPEFIAGKMMIIRSLVIGMDMVAVNPVANPLDHIPDGVSSISFAAMVPLQVVTAINSPRSSDFNKFGTVIIGGGQVDAGLREKLQGFRTSFYSTFGMTETVSHVALQKLNGDNQAQCMQALPGIHFTVDDRGCLVITAPYLGNSSIVTNDIVELINNENFNWLGRWDNVINSGGIKVMPELVEPHIETIFATLKIENRFFVHGIPHPSLGTEAAIVIEGILDPVVEKSVLEALKNNLKKYSAPRRIVYTDKFSFTPTGKIKRAESIAQASPRSRA